MRSRHASRTTEFPPAPPAPASMRRRALLRGAALLAVAALAGCAEPASPEQRLRESIGRLQAAIDARDASAIETQLADDFVGPEGMDRTGARRLAAASFLRYRRTWVKIGQVDIELQQGHARVRFEAALGGGAGQPLPEAAQWYSVKTGWREQAGEWRMTSAQWQPRL